MKHLLVILLALSTSACASYIGKAPRAVGVLAVEPSTQTITILEERRPAYRTVQYDPYLPYYAPQGVACRHHGNPEADGFYGCADSKQR
jgi:hypothetical protein